MPQFRTDSSSVSLNFRRNYSASGVQGAYWASVFGCASFSAFLAIAIASEDVTLAAILVRVFLVILLGSSAYFFRKPSRLVVENYQTVVATISGITLLFTIALILTGGNGGPRSPVGASPSLVFGLFIHYSFLRLSIIPAALVGVSVSLIYATTGAPIWLGGNEEVRTVIYLTLVNAVGLMVRHTVEQRESDLYLERSRVVEAEAVSARRAEVAERAHIEKSRLLAAVGHDVRMPISAALGYLNQVQKDLQEITSSSSQSNIKNALDSVRLIGMTLDHAMTVGRLEQGETLLSNPYVDLVALLARLYATLALDARTLGVELKIEVPEGYLEVASDEGALWQILLNLTTNSLKFTAARHKNGGIVLVRPSIRGGRCRIRIADTGVGISRMHREMIWQPYYQVGGFPPSNSSGVGLGLFLVRRAVDYLEHHEIRMHSRIGVGTIFTLLLPGNARKPASWVEKSSGLLYGSIELERLRGSFILLICGQVDGCASMLELFDEWGVVNLAVQSTSEVQLLMESEERAFDAIVVFLDAEWRSEFPNLVNSLRQSTAPGPWIIGVANSVLMPSSDFQLPSRSVILSAGFAPEKLAEAIIIGADENRKAEREI